MGRRKTPLEVQADKDLKRITKTVRMDKELSRFGRKVPGGMMWTVGDLQRFLRRKEKKRKR